MRESRLFLPNFWMPTLSRGLALGGHDDRDWDGLAALSVY